MHESTPVQPSVHATSAAIIAEFHQWHEGGEQAQELVRRLSTVSGYAASFDLDYADGDCSGLSIFHVDIHRGLEPHYIGVLYSESSVSVFLYGPRTFALSAVRDQSAEFDSSEMVTFDPHSMDERDAVGMFYQVAKCRPRQLATVDLAF